MSTWRSYVDNRDKIHNYMIIKINVVVTSKVLFYYLLNIIHDKHSWNLYKKVKFYD